MVTDRIYLLPLGVFVLGPATFCITYITAVVLGHVEADFPYISDTGTHVPESCIFGQLLNLGAFLLAICFYVRYKQVHTYYSHHLSGEQIPRLNKIALILGWIMAIGVSIVANFQETSVLAMHLIGALLAFGPCTIYLWVNVWLSYLVSPIINTKNMAHLRVVLASICTIAFLTCSIAAPLSVSQFHGEDRTKWYPQDGGFELHVISTGAEWTMFIAFDLFLLSLVREFQRITVATPQVYLQIGEFRTPMPVEEGPASEGGENNQQGPPVREFLA